MRRWITIFAALAVMTLPSMAGAQGTGYYEWSISSSHDELDLNTGPDQGSGIVTLFLWFVAGCFPNPAGMASTEFDLFAFGDFTVLAFNVENGYLNAGNATHLLMAVGGCPTGPVVAGNILINSVGAGAGGIRLGPSVLNNVAATVDCTVNPAAWSWPQYVRFRGFKTDGSLATLQDHGNGCTADPVDQDSWGTIKSLYR